MKVSFTLCPKLISLALKTVLPVGSLSYLICGNSILLVAQAKMLGAILDPTLYLISHIQSTINPLVSMPQKYIQNFISSTPINLVQVIWFCSDIITRLTVCVEHRVAFSRRDLLSLCGVSY